MGRLNFIYVLLSLFLSCTDISGNSVENSNVGIVTVIPEQDPNGIYWGLRDTVSGKLVLDYTYQKIGDFKDGFSIVMLNGKFGLVSKTGKQIIEPVYDLPKSPLQCGVIAFEHGYGPVVIYDTTGKSVMKMISGMTGLLPCQKRITYGNNRYGMQSFSGDTILPFLFTNARIIPEGFCIASKADEAGLNSLYGLYDLNGKEVLPHAYESMDGFYCDRAIVKKNGKYGVIDQTGKELFYTEYGRMDRFYNDHAIVFKNQNKDNSSIGIIDKNGQEVVPAIYQWLDRLYNFSEGLVAMAQNWKYGFVDTSGKVVIPFKYEKVESFQNGIAKVWVGWRYAGYINRKGEEIIPPDFEAKDQANLRRYHSRYIIGEKDSAQQVFDYSGKRIVVLNYQSIGPFDEDEKSFMVSMNNKYGILDSNLRVKIPVEYESLETVFPGKIAARKNGKTGFINLEGKMISPFIYDGLEPFQDDYMDTYESGLAKVVIKGMTGIINSYGKLIVPAKYDEIQSFSHGLSVVRLNNKYGFVNPNGKEVIPPVYDEAAPFDGNTAAVTLKGETFQIDISGNRVEEED